jgi:hypothetical protein
VARDDEHHDLYGDLVPSRQGLDDEVRAWRARLRTISQLPALTEDGLWAKARLLLSLQPHIPDDDGRRRHTSAPPCRLPQLISVAPSRPKRSLEQGRNQPWASTMTSRHINPGAVSGTNPTPDDDRVLAHLAAYFGRLHLRLDTLERNAADLMFLQVSSKELVLGRRRGFSDRSRAMMARAVAAEPYAGWCPCCTSTVVLTADGQPMPGAEFDHVHHRDLNRPEQGWLVCRACHDELTRGGYLVRFGRMHEFRRFQAAVLAQRPRPQARAARPVRPILPFDLAAE